MHGLPTRELQATDAQLYGEFEEVEEDLRNYFLQWVDKVELDSDETDWNS
jgi:hypothetical protein